MRGVYIIVEGQTEEEFVNKSLRSYFNKFEIYDVRAILVETSPGHKGGALTFDRFKRDIEKLLKSQHDIVVTSLIDFFRLRTDFPKYEEAQSIIDKQTRVKFLEDAVAERINNQRLIPYIQLHEFEGLLFSDVKGIEYIPDIPDKNKQELVSTINNYPNPELLNDGAETAPSKRLTKLIPRYQKTLHGPLIAAEIGVPLIIQKCPRFDQWVKNILKSVKN